MDSVRLDRWLWSVRAYKTRSAATEACRAGHVHVNGSGAKPALAVKPGDVVEARHRSRVRVLEVVRAITKRVGAPEAAGCYIDRSPPRPERDTPVFARERGAGRPTKRDRRELDRIRP
ncbi:MAG: RNA-binding S4 domain-containing protein [Acidimicrobiales bacterium]